ncbi:hypothetical protein WG68_10665 [Arsukibacterium ikkense]|uniref:Solute-binding protein family 3/N-terminal domain-containing protein n=1 Tax=Arsukibacterium ikkense TaxID=336831 RepID=A0A0M2V514_9GAMM|nr:transporter substrate-binding domain-containing protein [Arsukibacterium ikkense]KKO45494.1 hypothetical protein WG68_10665 [Arsukibacterium ikkense]
MLVSLLLPLLFLCQVPANNLSQPVALPEPIQLSTEQWPGFTEQDQSGAYFDLIRLIYQPYQPRLQVTFTNYNRALTLVRQQKSDMTLAVSGHNGTDLLLSARPIDQDKIVVIFHPGRHQLHSIEDLKPLQLAWNLAYDFGSILGLTNAGYEVLSVEHGIELTLNQRVDAYLAEQSQFAHYADTHSMQLAPLVATLIAEDNIYAAFANTEQGKKLKCIWDSRFQALLESGELQHFYQQYHNFYLTQE